MIFDKMVEEESLAVQAKSRIHTYTLGTKSSSNNVSIFTKSYNGVGSYFG